MIWTIIILALFSISTLTILGVLFSKVSARRALLKHNLSILRGGIKTRESVLRELAEVNLGLVAQDDYQAKKDSVSNHEEQVRAENGRLAITKAELEAVDTRLRELEEVFRELEASSIEASRELEMLRSQSRDIADKNEALKKEVEDAQFQVDLLLGQLAESHALSGYLKSAKSDMVETQEQIEYYNEQISSLNETYSNLKKAYDALDIEYAQLYEKHNSM